MALQLGQPWPQSSTLWKSQLDPVLANLLLQGVAINGLFLASGVPAIIDHKLQRMQVGFIITDLNANAVIYRSQPYNTNNITLVASANVTINLWNY